MRSDEFRLLYDIVSRRQPSLLPLVESLGQKLLTEEAREDLREVLAAEMTEAGLRSDSEPNEYGRRLDDLIGLLGSL